MSSYKRGILLTSLVCAAACIVALTEVGAQSSGSRSEDLTFSAPVQLPGGVVLPAGTYLFSSNLSGDRSVEVSTRRPKRLVAHLQTVATRRDSPGNAVTFRRTLDGVPPAVGAWYFNGGVEGYEFLYTSDELRALDAAAPNVNP